MNDVGTTRVSTPAPACAADEPSHGLPGYSLAQLLVRAPRRIGQVRQVQRDVARLPGAACRNGVASTVPRRHHEEAEEHHLVVLGDSVADGVGVDHHRNTITGRLAARMSERLEHPVAWHVIARSGADAREVLRLTHDDEAVRELRRADAVVISVGVNDVKNLRTEAAWRGDMTRLLERVRTLAPGAPVILLGVPPMNEFPAMPAQLGQLLGQRCVRFDAISAEVSQHVDQVHRLALDDAKLLREKAFGEDGFHPSPWMHKKIAKRADAVLAGEQTE